MAVQPLLGATPAAEILTETLRVVKVTPIAQLGETILAKRNVEEDDHNDADVVMEVVPAALPEMVGRKKRYLFGVSFEEVATRAVLQLAVTRKLGAPQELLKDMVFSIFVGYTVSRDWAVEYNNLHSSSILRDFEIDGRTVDRSDPAFLKNSWVNSSKMNSTAAHMFAYLIVDAAPPGGALLKLKTERGTPFTDASKKTAQGVLITELAKTLDPKDRAAATKFAEQFIVLIKVVDLIFGAVGADLDQAILRANKFKPAEF